MKRRHRPHTKEEDEVIDLRDRLAPYDHVAARPLSPPKHRETAKPKEPELFTSIEFDFDYRMGGRS